MNTEKRKYQVLQEGSRFTIGVFDEGYNAYIINDGIYGYYWWDTEEEAQKAADAYNTYEGEEWLSEHTAGSDIIYEDEIESCSPDMVELYKLFNAIKFE